jgi:hypothetical protein
MQKIVPLVAQEKLHQTREETFDAELLLQLKIT